MSDVFNMLFSQSFLIRALVVGILISLCSALLGVSLVLKRFSMIGDGLSHVAFGAMAIATAAGIAPLYFSLPIVVVAAFLLLRMSENGKIKGDTAIALLSTGALAVGVMATSMTTGMNIDIYNYMFGSILTMSNADVFTTAVISIVVSTLFIVFYHEIFSVTFDESFSKATGTKVTFYNMLIAALTAVTIVIGMRMMGALLISSLIIFPTVTSMRVCKSFRNVVISSVAVSVFCFLSGLILSIKYEAPTGASVVIVNIFMLGVFSVIRAVSNISASSRLAPFRSVIFAVVCVISVFAFGAVMLNDSYESYQKNKVTIVSTSFAGYDFARQIAADNAEVIMLLSPGEESHTYEPTPSDVMKIKECDLFVYVGGESERWVETILDSVGHEMKTVRMMDEVNLCENDESIHDEHEHKHEGDHSHGEYDEHVWTHPMNAIKISEAISEALSSVDEKHAGEYRSAFEIFKNELTKLDSDFRALMSAKKRDCIVIGDRFPLRYLTIGYNIDYVAAFPGCSAQVETNPAIIAELCETVEQKDIPVVFKVDLSKGEVAATVSEQTGAQVETLYSCHVVSSDDFLEGETYISLMRHNLSVIEKALV